MIRLYASPSWHLGRQVIADIAVLVWVILAGVAARAVFETVRAFASPVYDSKQLLGSVTDSVSDVGNAFGSVPLAGDQLRSPLDQLGTALTDLQAGADAQIRAIESAATVTGWITFLIPVLAVLLLWLPLRINFAIRATRTWKIAQTKEGRDLLALRALTGAPFTDLAALEKSLGEPLTEAWRQQDPAAIQLLSDLQLHRDGLAKRPR